MITCRMYLSPHRKLKSTIADTTRHPVWNESFQLLVSSYRDDVLTLLLYDHDRVTADERLGRLSTHNPLLSCPQCVQCQNPLPAFSPRSTRQCP